MDLLRLANPWVLAGLVPVWAVIVYAAGAPRHRRAGAPARAALACLATGLLVVALAGPSVRTLREGVCPVVLAQDISPSMSAAAGKGDPAEALAPWTAAAPLGRVILHPLTEGAESDLERGIADAARALPDGQGLLLLYTDARETRGDAVAAAARLAAAGIQTHAVAPDLRPRDVAVASLAPAGDAAVGRPVRVRVRLTSTVPAGAEVVVTRPAVGETPERTWRRRVTVDPVTGATLLFHDAGLPSGLYRYDACVRAAGDGCSENDRAACTVGVGRPQEILYVHGADGAGPVADVLARAAPEGAAVKTVSAASGISLAGATVVVLDNVSAWTLGARACRSLARRVTDGGLGLLALGGDAAFAAGGYADSPLEDILPVSSRTGERPPLDIVLIMDASGSMNETLGNVRKLALAKQAVLALRPSLGEADRIGIVAFAGEPRVVSPLTSVARWEDLRARMVTIQAGGGTRITPAVETAVERFAPPKEGDTTVRHIMLLSDGRSDDFDVDRLIGLCRDRRASASAVATGADAQRDHLGRLARETGGRLYAGGDLGRLAETFLKDMAFARGEGLRTVTRAAVWGQPEPVWTGRGSALPTVPACNVTWPKEGADVHWVTAPEGTEPAALPLLASWRRGLGKAAAMPWPVGSAGDEWLSDEAVATRFAPLLGYLAAGTVPEDWSARLVDRRGALRVRVEQRAEAIGTSSAPFVATVLGDRGDDAPGVILRQTAPGIHEADVEADSGAVIVVQRRDESGAAVTLSAPGRPPREFRRLGVDRMRLERIVKAGGGRIHTSPASLVEAVERIQVTGYKPVGLYLIWAAAAAVILQVILRLLGRL